MRGALGAAVLGVVAVLLLSSAGVPGGVASPPSPSRAGSPASGVDLAPTPVRSSSDPTVRPTGGPTASPSPAAPVAPSPLAGPTVRMGAELAELQSIHAPLKYAFLPNLNAAPDPGLANGLIKFGYSSAPAPLGVAAYGIRNDSGVLTPYTLSTPSVEGTFAPDALSGLAMDMSAPDRYGVQLNAVLNNVSLFGSPDFQFWTQNIVEYSTFSHQLYFISNIWNFSSRNSNLDTIYPNVFYQIGPNATVVSPDFYYGLGGPITISYPFTLHLFLNSTRLAGRDAVFFNFTLANSTRFYAGSFDHAVFNSTAVGRPAAPAPAYVASGDQYTDFGLPGDFEMVLGGPAGGSNFDVLSSQSYFGLEYWNASAQAYQVVPSAYDFGSETGETADGATALWGSGSGPLGTSPNALLTQGPAFLGGLWNVSGAPHGPADYGGYLDLSIAPSNAFVFLTPGPVFSGWATTNWSLFEWAPYAGLPYELDPGNWTIVVVLANYAPYEATATVVTGLVAALTVSLAPDPADGVYTPLWAFNNSALANISTLGALSNDQYGPIGDAVGTGVSFPWFGLANDYLYPVFPGIFLWNTSVPVVVNDPPSLEVEYPAPIASELEAVGFPVSNELQMLFYDASHVTLSNGASIGGWWYWGAYNGPSVSAYNVVFWNTSFSVISGNTFATGGNALYLYGGSFNLIVNNTFEASLPVSTDEYASVAATYGSVGLFEADYGNATFVASRLGQPNATSRCFAGGAAGFCDLIFNNIFLTEITADSPLYDPYAFATAYPTCPAWLDLTNTTCYFDEAWNELPGAVAWPTNILGVPGIGGNYWWNYGDVFNPYYRIPYFAFSTTAAGLTYINWGGDYLPLSAIPLYSVSFIETGLPADTEWYVSASSATVEEEGTSATATVALILPVGTYDYYPATLNPAYGSYGGTFSVTNRSLTIDVAFRTAYTVVFREEGLENRWDWWVDVWNSTSGRYLGEVESTNTTLNFSGLISGGYFYEAFVTGDQFAPNPLVGLVHVSGNTSATVTFLPIHLTELIEQGLPPGTTWWLRLWNATYSSLTGSDEGEISVAGLPLSGSLNWSVFAGGYVALPSGGTMTFGSNASVDILFTPPASLTFSESGLAIGASWTVWLTQDGVTTVDTTTGSSLAFAAGDGPYNFTVSAPGYTAAASSGSGDLPQSVPVVVEFTAITPAAGTLSLSVSTTFALASVNGVHVSLPFRASEPPGIYAIVVSSPGYLTYYNNVSVESGALTNLSISLAPIPTSSSGASSSGIGLLGWIAITALAALAAIFLATTLLFRRRGRSPPPPAPPPPAPASEAPSWLESSGPAPGGGAPPPTTPSSRDR